jgi:hypothetical protein
MKIRLVYIITSTLCGCVSAQQKVSDRTALSAGNLAPATDILPIVDVSAGSAGSKKITIDNLFTGWGTTTAGATLMKAADVAAQQAALSLVPGTHIQAYDADLASWAAKTPPSGTVVGDSDTQTLTNKTLASPVINLTGDATGDMYYRSAGGAFTRLGIGSTGQFLKVASGIPAWDTITGGGDLVAANNLSDLASAATARTNLGLGTAAVANLGAASEEIPYWTNTPMLPNRVITSAGGAAISSMTFEDLATELGVEPLPAYASQAEAEAGTDNVKLMTPLRTAQAIAELAGSGGGTFASQAQAEAGTDTTTYMNPLRTAQAIAALTPADQVTLAGAETLTNKTLTSPVINVTSDATGDIYYRSAGGAFTRLAAGTDGHVLTLASGLPSWAAAGGGGLTHWTESVNTSAPNASVPVVQFLATDAAVNVDLSLAPKGTGALTAAIADSTSAGGNKRGTRAVDWQTERTANTQVAAGIGNVIGGGRQNTTSGTYSTIAGGTANTATGNQSTIAGGQSNTASNSYGFVGGGLSNSAPGAYQTIGGGQSNSMSSGFSYGAIAGGQSNQVNASNGFVGGGQNNISSGGHSAVLGGLGNDATAPYSSVLGGDESLADGSYSMASGQYATTRGIYGASARAAWTFAAVRGDCQGVKYQLARATTNATITELTANGGSGSSTNRIVLPNNSVYSFTGRAVARSSGGDVKTWRFGGTAKRNASAGTTAIVGTVVTTSDEDSGASTWVLTIDADTTNGSLRFQGTGAAATNIRWTAIVDTTEITY